MGGDRETKRARKRHVHIYAWTESFVKLVRRWALVQFEIAEGCGGPLRGTLSDTPN